MKLGIDFGTTRIVVAFVDRGNYPVVVFEAPDGGAREWFPPLVAVKGKERRYGWEAWAAQEEPGWTIVRSLKRAWNLPAPTRWSKSPSRRSPCGTCFANWRWRSGQPAGALHAAGRQG